MTLDALRILLARVGAGDGMACASTVTSYLIAGTQSGCGKTTATLALMQYFRQHNKTIAPFKSGPDFLDPLWHAVACGRTSYNIDTRMVGAEESERLLLEKSAGADVTIIEGVMGLFDGLKGVGGVGSSAHLAKVLNVPVILVVSAKGMSGSIVPLIEGFVARAKAMEVTISGVIANHVGSENHAKILRELLKEFDLPPLLAWLSKDAPQLPERHLGLKMPSELDLPDFSDCLHVEKAFTTEPQRHRGLEVLSEERHDLRAENKIKIQKNSVPLCLCGEKLENKTIAISKDEAFCFIYPANIEWLQEQGSDVVYFSPLAGDDIPQHADALWLVGGYPELHLDALAQSNTWHSLRDFIESDQPVLAECGGMMMLGEGIFTAEGQGTSMAGILPCHFIMQDKLAGLGYREEASGVRGHEFHHSKRIEKTSTTEAQRHRDMKPAFGVVRGDAGIRYKNLRASYIHWYFSSNQKEVASWFTQ